MRFLIDASCPRRLVLRLRELGHDTDYAVDIDPPASDETWAAWATERGQVIVSQDYDFGALAQAGRTPFGVVQIAPLRGSLERRVERVVTAILAQGDSLTGALTTIEMHRVRRRALG